MVRGGGGSFPGHGEKSCVIVCVARALVIVCCARVPAPPHLIRTERIRRASIYGSLSHYQRGQVISVISAPFSLPQRHATAD